MEILASRVILRATDYQVTRDFYRDALGLAIHREYPGGTVFFAGQGLLEVSGHAGAPAVGVDDRTTTLWLQVRDASDAVAELTLAGVVIDRKPETMPWGLIEAWLKDPDGVPIVLVQVPDDHPLRRDIRGD